MKGWLHAWWLISEVHPLCNAVQALQAWFSGYDLSIRMKTSQHKLTFGTETPSTSESPTLPMVSSMIILCVCVCVPFLMLYIILHSLHSPTGIYPSSPELVKAGSSGWVHPDSVICKLALDFTFMTCSLIILDVLLLTPNLLLYLLIGLS